MRHTHAESVGSWELRAREDNRVYVCMRVMMLPALVRLITALYDDLVVEADFACQSVGSLPTRSGISQGCPLLRTLFALTLCPLFRRYMSTIIFASSRLCTFAGDLGLVLAQLVAQVGLVFSLFDLWALASALQLNPARCIIIPSGDVHSAGSG